MRLVVIVPSSEHLASAGVRIRYDRMRTALLLSGIELDVIPFAKAFSQNIILPGDFILFSKVYSAAALPFMADLRSKGHRIGIDIFDDYFSQTRDIRLQRYRSWLKQVSPVIDFAVASTEPLTRFLEDALGDDKLVITVPDSAPAIDIGRLVQLSRMKLMETAQSRTLKILWFGIGSNPYFSIGLNDLFQFSEELARVRNLGWAVDLTILTNFDALGPENTSMVSQLPVPWTLREWSLENEASALEQAFACFIPVRNQSFSRAKTLNRAISAIASGCQILTNGFPLYKSMEAITYGSAEEILSDIGGLNMRVGTKNASFIGDILFKEANAFNFAAKFKDLFLHMGKIKTNNNPNTAADVKIGLVHGVMTDPLALTNAKKLNALSVKSIFSKAKSDFDIEFRISTDSKRMQVWVHESIIESIADRENPVFSLSPKLENKYAQLLFRKDTDIHRLMDLGEIDLSDATLSVVMYGHVMHVTSDCLKAFFPDVEFLIADRSPVHHANTSSVKHDTGQGRSNG